VAFLLPRVVFKHNLLGNLRSNRIHPNTLGEPNPAVPTIAAALGSLRIPSSVVVWGSVVLSAKASSSSFF